jgi:hypothetical protein
MIQYLYLGRVGYDEALRLQAEIAELRQQGRVGNVLLLLEHPPVLTLGRNAHRANVLASDELLARRGSWWATPSSTCAACTTTPAAGWARWILSAAWKRH